MFKENGNGKIGLSNQELSEKINMSKPTISRCNKSLEAKGYLDIIKAKKHESGITINEKFQLIILLEEFPYFFAGVDIVSEPAMGSADNLV